MANLDWPLLAVIALFAFVGGLVREIRSTAIKKKELADYLIEGLVSAFTGIVVASLMMDYISETHLLFGLAGLSGYFGPLVLDLLKEPMVKFICRCTGEVPKA